MPGSCWDVGLGGGAGLTESCRSCRVFCASCLRLIGLIHICDSFLVISAGLL